MLGYLVDIVITIGIWSDGVIGPGLRWVFRYALLFVSAMSGFRRVLAVTLVSKKGPICLHLSVSISVVLIYLNYGCFYLDQLLIIHQISLLGTLQAMKNINNCNKLKIHT